MDTKALFDFWLLYSPKFPRQPHDWKNSISFVNAPWLLLTLPDRSVIAPWLLLTLPNRSVITSEQPVGELLKKSARGQVMSIISLVICHNPSFMNYQLTFKFIYFEFYPLQNKQMTYSLCHTLFHTMLDLPSRLGLQNTETASLQRSKTPQRLSWTWY